MFKSDWSVIIFSGQLLATAVLYISPFVWITAADAAFMFLVLHQRLTFTYKHNLCDLAVKMTSEDFCINITAILFQHLQHVLYIVKEALRKYRDKIKKLFQL